MRAERLPGEERGAVSSEYELTRDRMRAQAGPFTPVEQRAAEMELATLHADVFALRLRAREGEDLPTLEEWGTHYRRKAPLLVRLSLSDPLRYEDMARDAVARGRTARSHGHRGHRYGRLRRTLAHQRRLTDPLETGDRPKSPASNLLFACRPLRIPLFRRHVTARVLSWIGTAVVTGGVLQAAKAT